MKAQHVTTGADRDRAYVGLIWFVVLLVAGVIVAASVVWWLGVILIALGVLCGVGSRARLRGEI